MISYDTVQETDDMDRKWAQNWEDFKNSEPNRHLQRNAGKKAARKWPHTRDKNITKQYNILCHPWVVLTVIRIREQPTDERLQRTAR